MRGMEKKGLRVISLAFRPLENTSNATIDFGLEKDLIFIGLVGIEDALRSGVPKAVDRFSQVGFFLLLLLKNVILTQKATENPYNT